MCDRTLRGVLFGTPELTAIEHRLAREPLEHQVFRRGVPRQDQWPTATAMSASPREPRFGACGDHQPTVKGASRIRGGSVNWGSVDVMALIVPIVHGPCVR